MGIARLAHRQMHVLGHHHISGYHQHVSMPDALQRRLESPDIRAKENIRYELTKPQNTLTATGLLMEALTAQRTGRVAFGGAEAAP